MAHASFDPSFLKMLADNGIKASHMGEYRKPVSFPFQPVREATRKGTQLNSDEGLRIVNEIDKTIALLRGKKLNSSLIAPQTELAINGILDMGNISQYTKQIPAHSHPVGLIQGSSVPVEFDSNEEFEAFILDQIFGETPFAIGTAPNGSGVGTMRVASRIQNDEERFEYEGPQTSMDAYMERVTEQLAEELALEFLKVLFHVGDGVVKPFAMSTMPSVPQDIELLKQIMRMAQD